MANFGVIQGILNALDLSTKLFFDKPFRSTGLYSVLIAAKLKIRHCRVSHG